MVQGEKPGVRSCMSSLKAAPAHSELVCVSGAKVVSALCLTSDLARQMY